MQQSFQKFYLCFIIAYNNMTVEIPKSAILRFPFSSTRIFLGFKSLWIILYP